MTEMSVVLPQPLGPTRKLSSPKRALKSTPRSASIRVVPVPEVLAHLAARHGEIRSWPWRSSPEDLAGSSTSTRRMLRMLATITTKRMQAPVSPTDCHIRTMPRVASLRM